MTIQLPLATSFPGPLEQAGDPVKKRCTQNSSCPGPMQVAECPFTNGEALAKGNRPFCRYGGHFDFYCFRRHYWILRGQINMYLPPGHPIISIRNNINQNGRRIGKKVYSW